MNADESEFRKPDFERYVINFVLKHPAQFRNYFPKIARIEQFHVPSCRQALVEMKEMFKIGNTDDGYINSHLNLIASKHGFSELNSSEDYNYDKFKLFVAQLRLALRLRRLELLLKSASNKSLSLDLVMAYRRRIHDLPLRSYTQIEDAAAKMLPRFFVSSKMFEDKEGNKFYAYRPIFLQGLVTLSDWSAHYLSKHGGYLSLSGLTALSERSAKMLSRHKDTLHLDGLLNLTDSTARALSKHKGYLGLSGLIEMPVPIAAALSMHQGVLDLNGLTTLSDAVANKLSMHRGNLHLSGLASMTEAAASALALLKGELHLNRSILLSAAAVSILSKHGRVFGPHGLVK